MYTLLQIITYLNFSFPPEVNIITHFKTLTSCEKKIDAVYKRFTEGNMSISKGIDNDNNLFLKIEEKENQSYWFCKKAIFYKQ